jgi:serine/threonine protein kinase
MRPPPAGDPLVGQVVSARYRVVRLLGEGGMGQVFEAEQIAIEKKVALKVLKAELSLRADVVERFHREAVSACRIKHPNVVDVFDLGQLADGRFYLAMELLEGRDLAQLLAESAPLSPARGVDLALQICRALAAAHKAGVVHRDLKPENIYLHRTPDGDEVAKIVDFGIAQLRAPQKEAPAKVDGARHRRLTVEGAVVGTPEYMAPEQAKGLPIDQRVDIYAVGAMLYEMFVGRPPFTANTLMHILALQMSDDPPLPMCKANVHLEISPELEQVIMRALAKNPDERYASMAALIDAINSVPRTALSQFPTPLMRRKDAMSLTELSADAGGQGAERDLRLRETIDTAVVSQRSRRRPSATPGWLKVALAVSGVLVFALGWIAASRLFGGHAGPAPGATVARSPDAPIPAVALPLAAPTAVPLPEAAPAASPSVAAPATSASTAPKAVARAGRGTGVAAPTPASKLQATSLPTVEHCYETIGTVRREVPCP